MYFSPEPEFLENSINFPWKKANGTVRMMAH